MKAWRALTVECAKPPFSVLLLPWNVHHIQYMTWNIKISNFSVINKSVWSSCTIKEPKLTDLESQSGTDWREHGMNLLNTFMVLTVFWYSSKAWCLRSHAFGYGATVYFSSPLHTMKEVAGRQTSVCSSNGERCHNCVDQFSCQYLSCQGQHPTFLLSCFPWAH